jgi:hypothetical protein
MAKILFHENNKSNAIVVAALIVSIVITNIFVIFSPDKNIRFYNAGMTSTITIGVALVICLIQVYRYKKRVKMIASLQSYAKQASYYYDNNKMHFSICLFLGLWFLAHFIWTFPYQQTAGVWIADILWFIGYASFGYFLYSLFYYFFRKKFEPLVLVLIAIIISIVLVLVLDIVVSILRLLSAQPVDFSILLATMVYPVLDAALFYPAVLIFWGARKRTAAQDNAVVREQQTDERMQGQANRSFSLSHGFTNTSSIWIAFLSIAMMLSAIGDTGFAFSTAYGPDTVQRDVWIWDVIYNADHLCMAAALIGYGSFFSFGKQDRKSDSKNIKAE